MEIDLIESVDETKDGGYEGRGHVNMRCWRESQGKNNMLCSVGGDNARADTGLVGDLWGVIV